MRILPANLAITPLLVSAQPHGALARAAVAAAETLAIMAGDRAAQREILTVARAVPAHDLRA